MIQLIKDAKMTKGKNNTGVGRRSSAASIMMGIPAKKQWYDKYNKRGLVRRDIYLRAKRIVDLFVCLLMLPVAVPILLICYIVIKIDSPGPVFFSQERTGRGGRRFNVYKLRTMVKNAAELRNKYLHLNELNPPDFKITNDPRITRIGRFLRKTSLDELPQIFNVLKGDMTLVGPRPSSYGAQTYDLWHTARFELKPGMTGLAQVCGRSELLLDDKLRYDIIYLRNMSFWLDIQILLRTIRVVFKGHGVK